MRRQLLAPLLLGVVASALVSAPAVHAVGPETRRLCSDDRVRCSIQVPTRWLDGATHQVGVTGRPDSTIEMQAFAMAPARSASGQPTWTRLGVSFEVTTDDEGWGSVDVLLRAPASNDPGGPVLIAPVESRGDTVPDVLGAWTELLTATPELLGDGYGRRKPVGEVLSLALDHVVPGTSWRVEYSDAGTWVEAAEADGAAAGPAETTCEDTRCALAYVVPRGLPDREVEFRLVDVHSGVPVIDWGIRSDAAGQPRARRTAGAFAALSSNVPGALAAHIGEETSAVVRPRSRNLDVPLPDQAAAASMASAHDERLVQAAALLAGVTALTLAFVPLRRRRAR